VPPAPPDYSVVVPAFDEERYLPRTLESLRAAMASVPWRGEVIVCDNASTDATAAIAAAAGARVVPEPVHRIARVRNAGAAEARGRWLVFVDADTEVPPGTLRAALARLDAGTHAGGGSVLEMPATGSRSADLVVRTWNRLSRRFQLAAGSFVWVRREAFEAVGGFPESVYAGEEIGFARAVRRWGKARGLRFEVLDGIPVRTSARKVEWYPAWMLLGTMVVLTLCPLLLRSRTFCRIWYRRPVPAAGG
jgi:glycosyltransferase involved in cell wall biosynthesis